MQKLQEIFVRAARERVFPGGVVWLSHGDEILAHSAFGTTAYDDEISRAVATDTIYDIASLTKLFTATAVLIASRENRIGIETPVARFLPEFASATLSEITIRHLLNHTSGLKTHIQTLTEIGPENWIARIAEMDLDAAPGTRVNYTCTAYFLLGRLVENWTQQSLESWIIQKIIAPLGLKNTGFHPLRRFSIEQIAPTEKQENGVLRGVIHDEAARAIEENGSGLAVSGNAGIFSTAADLARFAQMWLQDGAWGNTQIFDERDARRAWTDAVPAENYRQGLGWHLDVSSWMGLQAPSGSAGHAGFTGPTLWISPATQHVCIVLNNRVYPTRNGPSRFAFHRRIAQWMLSKEPR